MTNEITRLTDLDLLHPRLSEVVESKAFETAWGAAWSSGATNLGGVDEAWRLGLTLHLHETHRPTAEQQRRYETRDAKGQRTTRCDGVISWSRHQDLPSTAVDFAVKLDGRYTWDLDNPLVRAGYEAIMHAAEALGFESGGRWPSGDWPHVQLWKADRTAEVQRLLNALGYDCGEVDGIHGRRTDRALVAFVRGAARDGITVGQKTFAEWFKAHVRGRIHPDEWTCLWAVAREKGVRDGL